MATVWPHLKPCSLLAWVTHGMNGKDADWVEQGQHPAFSGPIAASVAMRMAMTAHVYLVLSTLLQSYLFIYLHTNAKA